MPKQFKKIIPYFLTLIILVGLFGPLTQARAFGENQGTAVVGISEINIREAQSVLRSTQAQYDELRNQPAGSLTTVEQERLAEISAQRKIAEENLRRANVTMGVATGTAPPGSASTEQTFQQEINSGCLTIWKASFSGCVLFLFYWTYFQIPSLLLALAANFFNVLVSVALYNTFTAASNFLPEAWAVVRDFSNIFFILVLLYVAIQTILGLGHETKKIIVNVIIMALLINFSMFFTKIVIDSSNILALVFYNKLDEQPIKPVSDPKQKRDYEKSTSNPNEKDLSGAIYSSFSPDGLLNGESLEKLKRISFFGQEISPEKSLPFGLTLGLMFIYGSIMLLAAYAFFIAGFSFLGRLLELWVLIIFSPFAFMSWTLPKLSSFEYLGWDSWHKRLIEVSFMAPIFMFFMYLIFKILKAFAINGTGFVTNKGFIAYILSFIFPAAIAIILLLKAVKFAKKGGGVLGEFASGLGKIIMGLAVGTATGGTAMVGAKVLQGTVGRASLGLAKSTKLAGWETSESSAFKRFVGGKMRTIAGSADGKGGLAGSTFDVRKGVLSGALGTVSKITGVSMGMGSKGGFLSTEEGGYAADLERRHAKRDKRNEGLKNVVKADAEKELNQAKIASRELLAEASHNIGELDKQIDSAKQKAANLRTQVEAKEKTLDKKDPKQVKELADAKNAYNKQANAVINLGNLKSKIKNATGQQESALAKEAADAVEKAAKATGDEAEELKKVASALKTAANVAKLSNSMSGENHGKSINDYEDKILPELEHDVDKAVRGIEKRFISNLEKQWMPPWRNAERQASVEKLRLGIKEESHREKGGGHGTEHFLGDLVAGAIVNAASSHGHPPAPPTGGGGTPPATP